MELLNKNDGLILGIGMGFNGLVKSGLLPYGRIKDLDEDSSKYNLQQTRLPYIHYGKGKGNFQFITLV